MAAKVMSVVVERSRTETRLVVEKCVVTVELHDGHDLGAAISELNQDCMLDFVEWETVSTNDEDYQERSTVRVLESHEVHGSEPDFFINDRG